MNSTHSDQDTNTDKQKQILNDSDINTKSGNNSETEEQLDTDWVKQLVRSYPISGVSLTTPEKGQFSSVEDVVNTGTVLKKMQKKVRLVMKTDYPPPPPTSSPPFEETSSLYSSGSSDGDDDSNQDKVSTKCDTSNHDNDNMSQNRDEGGTEDQNIANKDGEEEEDEQKDKKDVNTRKQEIQETSEIDGENGTNVGPKASASNEGISFPLPTNDKEDDVNDEETHDDVEEKKLDHLTAFEVSNLGFGCDGCCKQLPIGSTMHGCRSCDYDVCGDCFAAAAVSPSEWERD